MAEITQYKVTIVTMDTPISKIITEEITYLSSFLLYKSNTSYTVLVAAINSQGSSEITSKVIISKLVRTV